MTPSDLRYQVSREWMEAEILAGRPVQHRRQALSVEFDDLDVSRAKQVEAILDAVLIDADSERVTVLDSGIDPEKKFGRSKDKYLPMDEQIVQAVGQLPELSEPTDDLDDVLAAWEDWLARYCAEALETIDVLNRERPNGENLFGREISWGGIRVQFGPGDETSVKPDDGPKAMQDARAAWAWTWAAQGRFSSESVEAAKEATTPASNLSREWIETLGPEEVAQRFLECSKRMHAAAKAHDAARRVQAPAFDSEMAQWASKQGSARLQLGIEDGYRMNARYLTERLAAEAPGFFAMPVDAAKKNWARRTASPSERALRLRRHVQAAMEKTATASSGCAPEVEIMTVAEPPAQMYLAHEEHGQATDFPSKQGWPWWYDEENDPYGFAARAFEAVVVKNWLGRFHLIGGVSDELGESPAGIWAVPQLRHFNEDGSVEPQNPDAPAPKAAKRKPPSPGEDDIPF
jgi:hypothetical protein